jgi:hypothetical protein
MMMRAHKILFYAIILSVGCLGQTYPDVIWVPVTFYDFHSDRFNLEFEQRHQGMLRTGMVDSTLGADEKPTLGPSPYLNYYVDQESSAHIFPDVRKKNFHLPPTSRKRHNGAMCWRFIVSDRLCRSLHRRKHDYGYCTRMDKATFSALAKTMCFQAFTFPIVLADRQSRSFGMSNLITMSCGQLG